MAGVLEVYIMGVSIDTIDPHVWEQSEVKHSMAQHVSGVCVCVAEDDRVGHVADINEETCLMADSGAMRTTVAPWAFTEVPLLEHQCAPQLRSITGEALTLDGYKKLGSKVEGTQLRIEAHVANVLKNSLSLLGVLNAGFTVVLSPEFSYITRNAPPEPERERERLQPLPRHRGREMVEAPSSTDALPQEPEEVMRHTPNELTEITRTAKHDTAVSEEVTDGKELDAEYLYTIRRDVKAWKYRKPRS
eukprot:198518-Amphidinium_carterae.1